MSYTRLNVGSLNTLLPQPNNGLSLSTVGDLGVFTVASIAGQQIAVFGNAQGRKLPVPEIRLLAVVPEATL